MADQTLNHWHGCEAARPVAQAFAKGQMLPRGVINVQAPIWAMGGPQTAGNAPIHLVFSHTDSDTPVVLAVHTSYGIVIRANKVNNVQNDPHYHCSATSMVHFIESAAVEAGVTVFKYPEITMSVADATRFAAERALLHATKSPL